MSIDIENSLFKQLESDHFEHIIEISQYNKRRRKLFQFAETIRVHCTLVLMSLRIIL